MINLRHKKAVKTVLLLVTTAMVLTIAVYAAFVAQIQAETTITVGAVDVGLNSSLSFSVEPLRDYQFAAEKTFEVVNNQNSDPEILNQPFYYRIYLTRNPQTSVFLENALMIQILAEDGTELYKGFATDLVQQDSASVPDSCGIFGPLAVGKKDTFTMRAWLIEGAGNEYQNQRMEYNIQVEAVQAKNQNEQDVQFNG